MMDDDGPTTTRWEVVSWACPRCGFADDEGEPTIGLQLVDSRDLDVDHLDIWEPEFDPEKYRRAKATEPLVWCPDCETVFDVLFEPREGNDE